MLKYTQLKGAADSRHPGIYIFKEVVFMALNVNKGAKEKTEKAVAKEAVKQEAAKVEAAEVASAPVEKAAAVVNENIGSKSHTIEFIAALGDPSRSDVTQATKDSPKRTDPTIVGYAFKATEDLMVPDVNPDKDFASNLFSFIKEEAHNTRPVKAGEQFNLTKAETALLISREEYNGVFSGGTMDVVANYTKKQMKNSAGKVMDTGAADAKFIVSLRAANKGQSIKDREMIPVLTFTKESTPNGGTRVNREIIPGFEKFNQLTVVVNNRYGSGAATQASAKGVRNEKADQFLASVFGTIQANKKA